MTSRPHDPMTALAHFNESDLLALIENELDPEAADALHRQLAAEPGALEAIERMRQDRAMLRELPDPEVPHDLLADLEPMLVRPMLMPEGDWRRRHRPRRGLPIRAMAAAVLVIGVSAAVWLLVDSLTGTGPAEPGETLVTAEAEEADAPRDAGAVASTVQAEASSPDEPAVVYEPSEFHSTPMVPVHSPLDDGPATIRAAEFVLVIRTGDPERLPDTLREALRELDTDSALVRNYSRDEIRQLERQLMAGVVIDKHAAEGGKRKSPPVVSGGRSPRGTPPARRQSDEPGAAHLFGSSDLVPTSMQQLEFARHGAAYTVSVPLVRLNDVLATLQDADGIDTTLRPTDAEDSDGWFEDYMAVQRAAAELHRTAGNTIVLLPVVVERK